MNRTYKILLAVLGVGVATFGYWHFLLAPKRQQVAAVETQVSTAQGTLAQAQATLATYKAARSAFKGNYATVVRLGKAVPADDDVRSMLVQLDRAAGDSDVGFSDITVGGGSAAAATTAATGAGAAAPAAPLPPGAVAVGGAGFSQLPLTFTFDGSYKELTQLLARMDRFVQAKRSQLAISGRLLRVEALDIQPKQEGWPQLEAKVTAVSFLVPATQGLTAGASAATPTAAAPSVASATPTPATTTNATTATAGVIR